MNKKNILITGGEGDIGFAIAERLAQQNNNIYLLDRTAGNTDRLIKLKKTYKESVKFYNVDLSSEKEIRVTIFKIGEDAKKIDALINNAGIYPMIKMENYTLALWNQVLSVNLTSAFLCTQLVLPYMKKFGGRIINVSSAAAHLGSRDIGYSASKSGMIGLTKSSARNLAKYKINVNAIAPGMVDSNMSKRMNPKDIKDNIQKTILKRIGLPSDISGVVDFLLSEDSSFITGSTIDINGGFYIR